MGSEFDSQAFKLSDASSYDLVVDDFDRFSDRLSLPLARWMIDLSNLESSDHVLDVGTGTGVVAFEAARWVGYQGKILGVDLSETMVLTAATKASQAGLVDRLEFRQMDAEAMELPDCSFDLVLSLFALLHFPRPLSALGEMFRVLRPGGRLVIAVGSRPPLLSFDGLFHRFKRLPDVWRTLTGHQLTAPAFLNGMVDNYFPVSHHSEESQLASSSLDRTSKVVKLIRAAGFARVQTSWIGNQTIVTSPEEFWAMQRTFSTIARKRLHWARPEKVADLKIEFVNACSLVQQRGGRLVYPLTAFYVRAQRPLNERQGKSVKK